MDEDPYNDLNTVSRAYISMDTAMDTAIWNHHDAKDPECFRTVAKLLTYADIPHLIRTRCHILLSLDARLLPAQSVHHAEHAVGYVRYISKLMIIPTQTYIDSCLGRPKSILE